MTTGRRIEAPGFRVASLVSYASTYGMCKRAKPRAITPRAIIPRAITPRAITPRAITPGAITSHRLGPSLYKPRSGSFSTLYRRELVFLNRLNRLKHAHCDQVRVEQLNLDAQFL
jgi:hypothetical protein